MRSNSQLLICTRCGKKEQRNVGANHTIKFCLSCGVEVNRLALKAKRIAEKAQRQGQQELFNIQGETI